MINDVTTTTVASANVEGVLKLLVNLVVVSEADSCSVDRLSVVFTLRAHTFK